MPERLPENADAVRVLVAEDHPMMVEAVSQRLQRGSMTVVGIASDADTLVERYRSTRPDVVICDVSLAQSSGIDATARIVADDPDAHVVMFSADISDQTIDAALKAGALGYIDKRVDGAELYECIRMAAEGKPVFDRRTSAAVIAALRALARGDTKTREAVLSRREIEVVALMAEGLTYDQIGERLYLSGKTVKTHASRAMGKLKVTDRSSAVAKAMRLGIIS